MMRVVGRLADGWFPSLPRLPLDEVPGRMRMIDEAAERAGRDPRSIRRIANLGGEITDGRRRVAARPARALGRGARRARAEHGFDGFLLWSEGEWRSRSAASPPRSRPRCAADSVAR